MDHINDMLMNILDNIPLEPIPNEDSFINSQNNNQNNNQNNRNNRTPSNRNNRNNTINNTNNNYRYSNRQLDIINNLISNYNENMNRYNRNISLFISLLYTNSTLYNRNTQNVPYSNIRTEGPYWNYSNLQRPLYGRSPFPQTRRPQPVPLRTRVVQENLLSGLRTFSFTQEIRDQYTDANQDIRCPISLQDYQIGDELCEIITCGHVFKKSNLLTWLNSRTTCPTCRTPVINNSANINNANINMVTFSEDLSGNMLDNSLYNNFIRAVMNNDISNNLLDISFNIDNLDASNNDIPDNASVD